MKKKEVFNKEKVENIMNNLTNDELNKIKGGTASNSIGVRIPFND